MLQGVNLEEIKRYNAALKQYKEKAASLNAEIEYTNRELDTLCSELTAELGIQVTRDNVEQIYNEQVAKINSTLQSGNAVLAKIASEENRVQTPVQPVQSAVQTPVQSAVQSVQPVAPQTPVQSPVQTPQPQPVPTIQPAVAGSVFGTTPQQTVPTMPTQGLPTMFSL
jgi:prefoldin subunit 5